MELIFQGMGCIVGQFKMAGWNCLGADFDDVRVWGIGKGWRWHRAIQFARLYSATTAGDFTPCNQMVLDEAA